MALLAASAQSASAAPRHPMVAKINKIRQAHGLAKLRYSPSLTRSSSRFARHLMRIDRFGHAARIYASRRFWGLGEVLALTGGWKPRRSLVARSWYRSPTHRGVILNPGFRYVGAGRARGRFGRNAATIWVAQLGRRR